MSGLVRADGELTITPETAGWGFSGLRVLELGPSERRKLNTGGDELIVLPLSGGCTVDVDGEPFALAGRAGVFAGVTDFLYVPRDARVEIASERGGRFALPSARADRRLPVRHVRAGAVPVELRGETVLEEIYYYEVARGGFAYQRVYGSGPGHEIDVCAEVRSGDAIVMPHGYH